MNNFVTDSTGMVFMGKGSRQLRLSKMTFPEPPSGHNPVPKFLKAALVIEDGIASGEMQALTPQWDQLDSGTKKLWLWQSCGVQQWCTQGKRGV